MKKSMFLMVALLSLATKMSAGPGGVEYTLERR